jgi:hypothetical protein
MKILKILGVTLAAALLLAGCGGSGTLTQSTSTTTGGGGTGVTPATLTLSSNSASILSDGSTTAKITALALDSNNVLLPGVAVTFKASSGGLAVTQATTDSTGAAVATLSTGGDPTVRTITVTATAGSLSATVTVQVIANGSSSPVAAVTVTSDTPTILSDGSTSANITALVRDASNNLIPNVPVVFTATSGGISATQSTTDPTGAAKAVLSTAGDPTLRTITVTAKVGTISATVQVQVVAGTGSITVQMGSGTGAAFVAGTIGISNASLSAGGSTSLQVVLQQSDGTLYTQSATISFSSACAAQNFATLTPSVTTTTGIATATYSASGCSGSDTITATATIGGRQLSASGTVSVAQAQVGSIEFVSTSAPIIALQGIGSSALPTTSTVTFQVLDAGGSPRPGATVDFTLNTSVGGVTLLTNSAVSDAKGDVSTIVQSGTVATPVRVTAVVEGSTPPISTQSNELSVSTGIPAQASFSISVTCHNVEAWSIDGIQVGVTARLADRFHNPVPDGTSVSFYTEGGAIAATCQTQTTNGNSSCMVNWTSQGTRPGKDPSLPFCSTFPITAGTCDRPGRSSLLAVAIGEESFTDVNGDGAFDLVNPSQPFNATTNPWEPWVDMGERYLDANENGKYDPGEFYYDFNNNHVHDGPDGLFNGVLCNVGTNPPCDPTKESTGIGAQNLIIMSNGTPDNLLPAPGTGFNVPIGGTAEAAFLFADLNNNPLPAGTIIAATIAGTGYTLGAPTSFTVPCTTEPTAYGFTISNTSDPTKVTSASGVLTLTITSPGGGGSGGVTTTATYPISSP